MSAAEQSIYSIPAGIPFAKSLVAKILHDYKDKEESLADVKLLLPTRRACRVVQEAFLQQSKGRALILPQIQPIGDIDEEELSLNIEAFAEDILDIPPAIAPLEQQILLAKLIHSAQTFQQNFDHALKLASALGHFMDQIYTENLDIADLEHIIPDDPPELADHWQITLDFLKILGENWPKILAERGKIDRADRRNRLILALAQYWQSNPPQTPIIAAGTTGSIPAVARLLSVIAAAPHGLIVLPGFDQNIDPDSWDVLEETHPQFGFKQLLERMGITRDNIQDWPFEIIDDTLREHATARQILAGETMRPAQTTQKWTELNQDTSIQKSFHTALQYLSYLPCQNEREEAFAIALAMRETLEDPNKTAALITPDRNLAKRVRAIIKRWNITIDDSAGIPLNHTAHARFMLLSSACCIENLAPVSLLAILKDKLCRLINHQDITALEITLLRGIKPAAGIEGLMQRNRNLEDKEPIDEKILEKIGQAFEAFSKLCQGTHSFKKFLKTHINMLHILHGDATLLWRGEQAEKLSQFLNGLFEHCDEFPDQMDAKSYQNILDHLMQAIPVRPHFGTHPRLQILGQLEARLIDADLVIMAGLNEGTWPPDPGHDPWMSRPMRKEFGLPVYERSVGLAAHDFVQGFCSPNILITRAEKKDGAPTIPARWLQRLLTVLEAAHISEEHLTQAPYKKWAAQIDTHSDKPQAAKRPEPKPPFAKRPQKLSVTRVETWMKDPYSIYARYILNLKKIDPLEQPIDAAIRGTLLHNILERFNKDFPKTISDQAHDALLAIAKEELQKLNPDEADWQFWFPRFTCLCEWYLEHEKNWRAQGFQILKTEADGATHIDGFELYARADRIDQGPGGLAIIDYKSGGQYSKTGMKNGATPQLALEALIAQKGGFPFIKQGATSTTLAYWIMTGRASQPGEIKALEDNLDDMITETEAGLKGLIQAFNKDTTPYLSIPRNNHLPRFNDYEHLARIKEWGDLEDEAA